MSARTKRRPNGDGTIFWDARRNRWRAAIDIPSRTGRRKRKNFSGTTRGDVARQLSAARERLAKNLPIPDSRMTVNQLIDLYIEKGFARRISAKTRSDNTGALRYAGERVGGIRLAALLPSDIAEVCNDMLDAGLSPSYTVRVRSVLGQALHFAEAEGLVARNVAKLAPTVEYKPKPRDEITMAEAAAFAAAALEDDSGNGVVLSLALGLRPGEMTGLAWSSVDLDEAIVEICQSLKRHPDGETGKHRIFIGGVKRSSRAERTLEMPSLAVDVLRAQKAQQEAAALAAGPAWVNEHDLCFTTSTGTPIDPANLRRTVRRIADAAGIEKKVVPYDMRRTMTSILSEYDVMGERIADVTGNDPKIALSVYRRRLRAVADAAVDPMNDFFGTLRKSTED